MGTKLIILFILTFLFACSTYQKRRSSKFIDYKKMALCECIIDNYRKVSDRHPISKDVSKSVIFQGANFSIEKANSLDSFVRVHTLGFETSNWSNTSSEDSCNNEIINLCLSFSNSKELEKFILVLIKN